MTLFESNDVAEIRQLIDEIRVLEQPNGGGYFCYGDPTFEFYDEGGLIAELTMFPGLTLRWSEWPGDGILTKPSEPFFVDWCAKRNVMGPLKTVRKRDQVPKKQEE